MKRIFCLLVALSLIISLAACGTSKTADRSNTSTTLQNGAEKQEAEHYSEIKQCFEINNADVKVRERDKRIEVVIVSSELSSDTEPENWSEIIASIETAMTNAQPLAESKGFTTLSAQLETTDGTILASGYNQKMQFDLFHTNTTYKEAGNGLITLNIFNKLQTGMTYAEVRDMIGADGVLTSSVDIGDYQYKTETYTWDGSGDFGANAIIMFQGGELTTKSQYGLK